MTIWPSCFYYSIWHSCKAPQWWTHNISNHLCFKNTSLSSISKLLFCSMSLRGHCCTRLHLWALRERWSTVYCPICLCPRFVRQWHYILIQSNLYLEKDTDTATLSLLQQIKSDSHYWKADNTATIQYHYCMTKTGNMGLVGCRIYNISEGNNWLVWFP